MACCGAIVPGTGCTHAAPADPALSLSSTGTTATDDGPVSEIALVRNMEVSRTPEVSFLNSDSKGNLITVIATWNTADPPPGDSTLNGVTSFNADGTKKWHFSIAPTFVVHEAHVDSNDNVLFVTSIPEADPEAERLGVLWKLSSTGQLLWKTSFTLLYWQACALFFEDAGSDAPTCVLSYPPSIQRFTEEGRVDGDAIALPGWPGWTAERGSVSQPTPVRDGFYLFGSLTLENATLEDVVVAFVDRQLETTWRHDIPHRGGVRSGLTASGDIVVTWGSENTEPDGIHLRAYNTAGMELWNAYDPDFNRFASPDALMIDRVGNIIVAGNAYVSGVNAAGEDEYRSDIFVVSYAPDGRRTAFAEWGSWDNLDAVVSVALGGKDALFVLGDSDNNKGSYVGWILEYALTR